MPCRHFVMSSLEHARKEELIVAVWRGLYRSEWHNFFPLQLSADSGLWYVWNFLSLRGICRFGLSECFKQIRKESISRSLIKMTNIASRRDFQRVDRWIENDDEFSTFYFWKLVKEQDECKCGKIMQWYWFKSEMNKSILRQNWGKSCLICTCKFIKCIFMYMSTEPEKTAFKWTYLAHAPKFTAELRS